MALDHGFAGRAAARCPRSRPAGARYADPSTYTALRKYPLGPSSRIRARLLEIVDALLPQAIDLVLGKARLQRDLRQQLQRRYESRARHLYATRPSCPSRRRPKAPSRAAPTPPISSVASRLAVPSSKARAVRTVTPPSFGGSPAAPPPASPRMMQLRQQQGPAGHVRGHQSSMPVSQHMPFEPGEVVFARRCRGRTGVEDAQPGCIHSRGRPRSDRTQRSHDRLPRLVSSARTCSTAAPPARPPAPWAIGHEAARRILRSLVLSGAALPGHASPPGVPTASAPSRPDPRPRPQRGHASGSGSAGTYVITARLSARKTWAPRRGSPRRRPPGSGRAAR